jgi:hypothetical protein
MKTTSMILGLLILVLVTIIFGPFAVIFALNSLFELTIGYTFVNWLSVVIIHLFINSAANAQVSIKK